jgi:hypothetical protein
VKQANRAGTLPTVGLIGTDISGWASFEISGRSGIAYAAVADVALNRTTFWMIDLDTGAGSMICEVGGGAVIGAMTVVPAPAALSLLGLAGLLGVRRRR